MSIVKHELHIEYRNVTENLLEIIPCLQNYCCIIWLGPHPVLPRDVHGFEPYQTGSRNKAL